MSACHGLEVDAGRALARAALVDRRHRRVERLQPGHDAVGQAVGAADQRAARRARGGTRGRCRRRTSRAGRCRCSGRRSTRGCPRASRAGSSSTSAGACVPELNSVGELRQVVERRDQPVEARSPRRPSVDRPQATRRKKYCGVSMTRRRLGVRAAGSGRRRCADRSTRSRSSRSCVDRVVELAGVAWRRSAAVSSPMRPAAAPRAIDCENEWMSWFAHLLVDERGEQAGGKAAVARLLADQRGRGADRQLVELLGGGPVVQAADRAGRDAHRIDALEHGAVGAAARPTARTILLRSTGSRSPLRLRTRIGLASPHGVSSPLFGVWALGRSVMVIGAAPPLVVSSWRPRRNM